VLEEGTFLRSLIEERVPVRVRCRDGYEIARGIIRDADTFAVLVETPNGLELLRTHALVSIVRQR
jgi:sRNA-binding regulator protein Hfq